MSIKLMTLVWDMELDPGEKLVLLCLADQANDDGKPCWPAVETICRRSGQKERTVRRILSALEKSGHITRKFRSGTSTVYYVHPCPNGTPAKSASLPNRQAGAAKSAGESCQFGTQTVKEPSNNLPPKPPKPGERKARVRINQDWKAPALDGLPPHAAGAARQWPDGAYAVQAEAFALFHRGSGNRRADWDELWAAWVIRHHEGVMRAAKHGHGVVAPQLAEVSRAVEPKPASAAKAQEDGRSADLHDVLREQVGDALWAEWYAPAALLIEDDRLVVTAPSKFHRSWMEDRCGDVLNRAIGTLGIGIDAIDYQMIAPAKGRKRGRA